MNAPSARPDPGFIPRLAVIDDSEFDQMLCARLVRRVGNVANTLNFNNPEEAITYFETPNSLPVDVILLDINMPGMSGFDFLDQVGKSGPAGISHAVVVMLSTSLELSDLARANTYDIVKACVEKPLQTKHLSEISGLLSRAHIPAGNSRNA